MAAGRHLAHHVDNIMDSLDLSARSTRAIRGDGRRNSPFCSRMMVKVLVYAYASGGFSSRRIPKQLEEDVAFRFRAKVRCEWDLVCLAFNLRRMKTPMAA